MFSRRYRPLISVSDRLTIEKLEIASRGDCGTDIAVTRTPTAGRPAVVVKTPVIVPAFDCNPVALCTNNAIAKTTAFMKVFQERSYHSQGLKNLNFRIHTQVKTLFNLVLTGMHRDVTVVTYITHEGVSRRSFAFLVLLPDTC